MSLDAITAWVEHRKRPLLAATFITAFLLRLLPVVFLRTYEIDPSHDHFRFGYEVGRVARSLAEGHGFASPLPEPTGPTAWFAPIFPLVLAGIFKIFGVYTTAAAIAIFTFNALLGAATCLLAYWLARTLMNPAAAIGAAFLLAIHPSSIYYSSGTIWDTSLLAGEVMLIAFLIVRMEERADLRSIAKCGFVMGLALLTNPAPGFLFPFLIAWLAWRLHATGQPVGRVLWLAVIPALMFLPWMLRNYFVTEAFTPRCCPGVELMLSNNDIAWQTKSPSYQSSLHPAVSRSELTLYEQLGESGYDRYSRSRALRFIRENPRKAAELLLIRVKAWWLGEDTGSEAQSDRLAMLKRIVLLLPLPFLLYGIVEGLRTRWAGIVPMALIFLVYPLPYYLFNVNGRMRYPIEPIGLVIAAFGIWRLLARRPLTVLAPRSS